MSGGAAVISLDCETTGVDLHHGAKPFFVSTCTHEGVVRFWEWFVDPHTREPIIPPDERREVGEYLFADGPAGPIGDPTGPEDKYGLVLHNTRFDFAALNAIGLWEEWDVDAAWGSVKDTLMAAHLLGTSHEHDLTSCTLRYLDYDILPLETALEQAVKEARRYCQHKLKDWAIASPKADRSDMPSVKTGGKEDRAWRFDYWLPRALANHLWQTTGDEEWSPPDPTNPSKPFHKWWTVLSDYATADAEVTLPLWNCMRGHLRRRGLMNIYDVRMRLLPIVYKMDQRGVSLSRSRLEKLTRQYEEQCYDAERLCTNIAKSYRVKCEACEGAGCPRCEGDGVVPYQLTLPKGGRNRSLDTLMLDVMRLPPVYAKKAKSDAPTLNKEALTGYLYELPERGKPWTFIKTLLDLRKRNTALSYMSAYHRFWVPTDPADPNCDYYTLHPNLNPTGTGTLRFSCRNPNEQNIAKQGMYEGDKENLRYLFGPAPGREWWSCDANNIELRIPAYEAREEAFIALFERPKDPPYFGSNHLLIAHILHPALFDECLLCISCSKEVWVRASTSKKSDCCGCARPAPMVDGRIFKKRYAATWYQWVKNGNFAVQYGAVDKEDGTGTADRAYHLPGAQSIIKSKFKKMEALNQHWIRFAERHGYVETMPDKEVDPKRGYPIMCTRTEYGRIKPTVPLNYHVQGTAMWWMIKAMIRCQEQLDRWRGADGYDGYIVMQVHDELVFDLPRRADPKADPKRSNLARINKLRWLMSRGGDDIGLPTPVGCEYHAENWSVGVGF